MSMIPPQPQSSEEFESWNNDMASKFDPDQFYGQSSALVRVVEHTRLRVIAEMATGQPTDTILEVGCGGGHILDRITAGTLYGVDLSPFMLEKARARLGDRATIVKGDGQRLPFDDGMFTTVVCSEVIEHVPDPAALISEIARVLKPGGTAIISIPNEPLINRLKSTLRALGLFNVLLNKKGGYTSSERMDDEWHLHSFTLPMLQEVTAPRFTQTRMVGIPNALLPIRYVGRFLLKG